MLYELGRISEARRQKKQKNGHCASLSEKKMSKNKTLQKERTEPDRDEETCRDEIDVHDLPHQNMQKKVEAEGKQEEELSKWQVSRLSCIRIRRVPQSTWA